MGENKLLLSTFDRRRILLIALLTCVLLPTLWLISRNTTEQTDGTSAVTVSTLNSGSAADDESLDPIILGGPAPIIQDGSAQIAYPGTVENGLQAIATFSSFDNAPDVVCFFPQAPMGISIIVTNINNGRTVKCTNVFRTSLPSGATGLLHTKIFESISNLVDAPIPVIISW